MLAMLEVGGQFSAFELESRFLQDPGRGWVGMKHRGFDPHQIQAIEGPLGQRPGGFRGDSPTPKWFTEPVAEFRHMPPDTRPGRIIKDESNAADDPILTGDGELAVGKCGRGQGEPIFGILFGVGMRDPAHVAYDIWIVNELILTNRPFIAEAKWSQRAVS